jgi:photosystem II stability/assembly factor-like uncharacterized protein
MSHGTISIRRVSCALAAAALLAAPLLAETRSGTWWRLPVWGADVRDFAVDPFQPGHVTLGTARGNFYGSDDGGETWKPLRPGRPFPGFVVAALVADPDVPDRLWAALAGQNGGAIVARSDDRGAEWSVLARWERSVAARTLAISPKREDGSRRIAIGGDDGVRLSTDGGATWKVIGDDVPGLWRVESLSYDPKDPETLYAGTWRLAYRTKDGGKSWKKIDDGMVLDSTVYNWDFSGSEPVNIWVSTCGWVYRSQDAGETWKRFKEGFTNRRSHAVKSDPKRPDTLYAATVGGLHRSTDGGQKWTRITRESMVVTALDSDPRTGRLYVGTEGEGVFVSDDGGDTFQRGSVGLAEGRIPDVAADPAEPDRVLFFRAYAGEETGVWEARGTRVRRLSRGTLPAEASLAVARAGGESSVLVLASASGVLISTDGGEDWKAPESPPPGTPLALFGAPFDAPVLVTTDGVFRARDGKSFSRILGAPGGVKNATLLLDGAGEPVLQVRTEESVLRWSGGSWSPVRSSVLKGGIFRGEGPPEPEEAWRTIYEREGVLVWREAGRRLTLSSPAPGLAFSSAVTAPGGRLYVGTTGDGLYLFEPDVAQRMEPEDAVGGGLSPEVSPREREP